MLAPSSNAVRQRARRSRASSCQRSAASRLAASGYPAMDSRRFDTGVYARRLTAAAAATADAGLAGLVITPGYDLRYLVGFARADLRAPHRVGVAGNR